METAAIRYNLDRLLTLAGKTPLWAVLKGNGYGLGVGPMAQLCWEAGIRRFAVTEIAEALAAKKIPVDKRKIVVSEPIKNVGTYTVKCKLGYEVVADLTVEIQEA